MRVVLRLFETWQRHVPVHIYLIIELNSSQRCAYPWCCPTLPRDNQGMFKASVTRKYWQRRPFHEPFGYPSFGGGDFSSSQWRGNIHVSSCRGGHGGFNSNQSNEAPHGRCSIQIPNTSTPRNERHVRPDKRQHQQQGRQERIQFVGDFADGGSKFAGGPGGGCHATNRRFGGLINDRVSARSPNFRTCCLFHHHALQV